jgi:hypothetical protein
VSGRGVFRAAALALGVAVVMLPVSAVATFLLLPLWSWVEARWGIESVGHSGPADWCFVAVYAASLVLAAAAGAGLRRRYPPRPD